MPLTAGELDRIRTELGYNVLNVGAEPFIGVQAIFSQVLQPYLREGADTTSSTATTATGVNTLTLGNATGITVHSRVAIDVDSLFEYATVRAVSGNQITVILNKLHPASYPVTVDAGLCIVREILANIAAIQDKIANVYKVSSGALRGNIKKVDEIEFYDTKKSALKELEDQLEGQRDRLAGCFNMIRKRPSGGGAFASLY